MRWKWIPAATVAAVLCMTSQSSAGNFNPEKLNMYQQIELSSTLQITQNGTVTAHSGNTEETVEPFEEPFMDGDKAHGFLGAASMLAAVMAGVTAPDNENPALVGQPIKKGFHHYAGLTAAALGGAAVISGLIQHMDDLEPSLLDPDTAHMILGVLATSAYAYAVSQGPKKYGMGSGSHAAAGIAGGAMMLGALYIEF
ncbi:hypothetical protein [Mariprofundus sp. EBB-1]|uniref:hypothetical protein n=1 Tax=Mariprofundus sp. EBB-1 TaxID=2650971 RepID=UPI0011C41962|nr:hypothetical protein [Mariprofundus sp. EBB-1]